MCTQALIAWIVILMEKQIKMIVMKKKLNGFLSLVLIMASTVLLAQENVTPIEGTVSYVSSQNVYVKFASTDGLQQGDTLYIVKDGVYVPALLVQQLSSMSCVSKTILTDTFKVGDTILGRIKNTIAFNEDNQESGLQLLLQTNEVRVVEEIVPQVDDGKFKQTIYGRIKLSAYSNFSDNFNNDNQRFRYTLNFNANNIANSAASLETYVAFSHRIYNGTAVPSSLSDIKLYALALRYDLSKNTHFWLGRKINRRIANLGAVDGFQAETTLKNFIFGAVVGSRPSYVDYGFDFNLFEFGVYAAHEISGEFGMMENTFSIFEQKNNGNTDRRFMYFQHANSLANNLYAFASFEVDMYRRENGIPINDLSLTSMFVSLRYKFSSKLSATASYDARKNVVYYETFQNIADSILESSTRQGYRLRINYRPIKKLSLGASASYRDRPEDNRPSKNANAYIRYSQLPYIKAAFSFTFNILQTAYLDGRIFGAGLNKDLFAGKWNMGLNYRNVNYDFVNSTVPLNQNIAELNLQWNIIKNLNLSASYEGVFETDNQYNRIYLNLRKRF